MKVSIIIPTYNYAHFLKETLLDLLNQSYNDWECIVVDNNSTDDTKMLVETFANKDNRFKYLLNDNKGPSISRNIGVKASTGDFIQFLDADDFIQSKKLISGLQIFGKNENADLVYSDMRYFADGNISELFYYMTLDKTADRKWMSYVNGGRKEVLPILLNGNMMVISSPLIRKSALLEVGLYDETLVFNEDWELWLRFALKNKNFVYDNSPDTITLIRVHQSSHSKDGYKMYYSGLKVCLQIFEQLKLEEINKSFTNKIKYHELILSKMLYEGCSDKNLTSQRLNELSLISKYFNKMSLSAKKYSGFMLKSFFYVNYLSNSIKYKPNA